MRVALLIFGMTLFMPQALSFGQNGKEVSISELAGTWTLTAIYKTANPQGPSPSEQKRLLGAHIIYSAQKLTSCGASVEVETVERRRVSREDLLDGWHVRFSDLRLQGDSVQEVIVNRRQSGSCFGAFPLPGQDVYVRNQNEIIVAFEGVFYRAVRR